MARCFRLTFRGRDRKNQDIVITRGRLARCPAKISAPRYVSLTGWYLRPRDINTTTKAFLLDPVTAQACINGMLIAYRANCRIITRNLRRDLQNHVGNMRNVNKIVGRIATLIITSGKHREDIQTAARTHGPDSPEAGSAIKIYDDTMKILDNANKYTELIDQEYGAGTEIAEAIRRRILDAVEQRRALSAFYEEVLNITQKVVEKKSKTSLDSICNPIRAAIRFDDDRTQREFIKMIIFDEEIDLAMKNFEIDITEDRLFFRGRPAETAAV
ncbi:MAG: hypothetical protein LBC41_10795 [Clostridiales bacterium]|jgi:hypothetical protein|nr:hypothetical protein [Clostridiales bacterium]